MSQKSINISADYKSVQILGGGIITVQNGGGGGGANLAYTASSTQGVVTSDTGTDATIPAGSATNASLMLPADKTKLDSVASGATANATDAQLRDRTTHTGSQAISTVTGLQTALDGKQATGDYATNTALTNGLATKENTITAGTVSQYYRGDKTFQTLDKTAVGLANVDNTSDLNKPISTATQTALNAKQDTLVSGVNIKTINSQTLLGSGDIVISGGSSETATILRKLVRNQTGSTIPKGTAVYQFGSSGIVMTVAPADASLEATASQTLGITQEAIANNTNGYVVAVGLLDGINTSALTEGQIVWLSETAGELTSTRPTQPAHGVVMGYCVKQGGGASGILYVKVDNGLELAELHDVLLTGAVTGDVLAKASDGLWKPLGLTKSSVGLSNVDNTSDANKPVSTATQTALNAKENTITAGTTAQYYRGDKSFQTLDKSAVGLANVDNTSDANKPISTATQTALNAKQNTITTGTTAQYFRGDLSLATLDKTAVGLSNVDNTSDANKPVSTATQTALNAKENTLNADQKRKVTVSSSAPTGGTDGDVWLQYTP